MADDASEDTSAVEANTFEKDAGLCSCEGGVDCNDCIICFNIANSCWFARVAPGFEHVALEFAHVVPSTPTP